MGLRIIEATGLTDVGRQRQSNEDRFFDASPVFAVADGMGGARAGEVASRIAVETFDEALDPAADPEAQLAAVARAANRRIWELAQSDEAHAGMGTTLTSVMVGEREVAIGHVGDSRLYRLRDGELDRLTTDHSLVEEWVRAGKLSPEAAEHHPQKSIITRALGPEREVEVDTFTCPSRDGDVYLLCSDGLTGMVSEDQVADILRASGSLEKAARTLIDAANHAGGRDNITVVLFRLGDDDGTAAVAADDPDTLSGRETEVALSAGEVRRAVAEADAEEAAYDDRPGDGATEDTLMVGGSTARELRSASRGATAEREAVTSTPRTEEAPRPARATTTAPRRRRRALTVLATVLVVALLVAGLYAGSRQVWFVGASEAGFVTLFRGVPYDGPFGLDLYSPEYESTVPARSLREPQRSAVLEQRWRGREDAADLVRSIETRPARR